MRRIAGRVLNPSRRRLRRPLAGRVGADASIELFSGAVSSDIHRGASGGESMAKNTYQTYTNETPIGTYRTDFIRRSAMCGPLVKRYDALGAVVTEADAILVQIDTRLADLQQAEDDQVRARALEDVQKLDVVDIYTELRRTMTANKQYEVMTLLPDAPSVLGRFNAKTFGQRADQAVANLRLLADDDTLKTTMLSVLEKELGEFKEADVAEDVTRSNLKSGRMALVLYKTELSQAREMQLGAIQKVFGDREKTALFTTAWRKAKSPADDEATEPPPPK
jgi:hypothetical protein